MLRLDDGHVLAERYANAKVAVSEFTGAPEAVLHIHAGLLIFVLSALLLQRRMRSPAPLVLVVLFALANEILDALGPVAHATGEWRVDIANTVFWPAALFLIARRGKASAKLADKTLSDEPHAGKSSPQGQPWSRNVGQGERIPDRNIARPN